MLTQHPTVMKVSERALTSELKDPDPCLSLLPSVFLNGGLPFCIAGPQFTRGQWEGRRGESLEQQSLRAHPSFPAAESKHMSSGTRHRG